VLSCAAIRALEERCIRELSISSLLLMENAGRGAAELLVSLGVRGPVLIACGKGNNGGDGLVMARHLDNVGVDVRVLLFGRMDELSPDAATNGVTLLKAGLPVVTEATTEYLKQELPLCEWVVDALFGTGLKGPLRAPFDEMVTAINDARRRVLAIDIPSGLDGDTGQPLGPTIRADHTATFLACKQGFAAPGAEKWTGRVYLLDIGLPRSRDRLK